jgi:hypothetical protein
MVVLLAVSGLSPSVAGIEDFMDLLAPHTTFSDEFHSLNKSRMPAQDRGNAGSGKKGLGRREIFGTEKNTKR